MPVKNVVTATVKVLNSFAFLYIVLFMVAFIVARDFLFVKMKNLVCYVCMVCWFLLSLLKTDKNTCQSTCHISQVYYNIIGVISCKVDTNWHLLLEKFCDSAHQYT